jgi:hypothetical protein
MSINMASRTKSTLCQSKLNMSDVDFSCMAAAGRSMMHGLLVGPTSFACILLANKVAIRSGNIAIVVVITFLIQ